MNQPTEDRIKRIEERQDDFDKRLKEVEQQQTEPIQVTVERRYPDKEIRADILSIKATQSDHGEMLKNMATKDDLIALKNEHGQKFDEHSRKLDEQHEMLRQILRLLGQQPD